MAITALHTAATGMQALSSKIDVIAHNIANAETVGYKSSRANFEDLLYQLRAQPGVQTSDDTESALGTQVGLGVKVSNTQILFQQGSAMLTNNGLDALIEGDGFFQIELPGGGTAYTRAGAFIRNAQGELVMANHFGHRLLNTPAIPDEVAADRVTFTADGRVVASLPDGTSEDFGQIELARFANPSGLLQYGSNLFLESEASGEPVTGVPGQDGLGTLLPSALELSTTEAVKELVELIKTQRVFQMNSQSVQAADQALQTVANLRR